MLQKNAYTSLLDVVFFVLCPYPEGQVCYCVVQNLDLCIDLLLLLILMDVIKISRYDYGLFNSSYLFYFAFCILRPYC